MVGSLLQKLTLVLKRELSPGYCGNCCGISLLQGPTNLAPRAGFPKIPTDLHLPAHYNSFVLILPSLLIVILKHFSLCVSIHLFLCHPIFLNPLCLGSGLRTSRNHFEDKKIVKSFVSLLSLLGVSWCWRPRYKWLLNTLFVYSQLRNESAEKEITAMTTSVSTVMIGCSCAMWSANPRLFPPPCVLFLGFTIQPSCMGTHTYDIVVAISNRKASLKPLQWPNNPFIIQCLATKRHSAIFCWSERFVS